MRIATALLAAACLAGSAPLLHAQFTQFNWTLDDSQGGLAGVDADNMALHGVFSTMSGAVIKYTTTAHSAGRVTVQAWVVPEDGFCGGGGSEAFVLQGASTTTYATCNYLAPVSFDVDDGQSFGFGLKTIHTGFTYSVYLSDFQYALYWNGLGAGLSGTFGTPQLTGTGILQAGQPFQIQLSGAPAGAPVVLVAGYGLLDAPFKGGLLVPTPDVIVGGLAASPTGGLALGGTWPAGLPSGFRLYVQAWVVDVGGPAGFSATNGLVGTQL